MQRRHKASGLQATRQHITHKPLLFILAVLVSMMEFSRSALAQTDDKNASAQSLIQATPASQETVDQTAQLIGVKQEITDLQGSIEKSDHEDRWNILYLHQYVSERVMAASLQVDATIAQIDNEIARAQEVSSFLSDLRDRAVTRANLFGNLIGGGLSALSSGMQLSSGLNKPAASVGISAGFLSASFGMAGIRAQRGATAKFDFESNMLAAFLDRPALSNSQYPPIVIAFLNEVPLRRPTGATRRQELIATWIQVRRIDSLGNTDKLAKLTSQPSEQLKLTIDDLGDRAAMLQDVRARISFLKRDLGVLLGSLPAITNYTDNKP